MPRTSMALAWEIYSQLSAMLETRTTQFFLSQFGKQEIEVCGILSRVETCRKGLRLTLTNGKKVFWTISRVIAEGVVYTLDNPV